jgi:hypothetical protein
MVRHNKRSGRGVCAYTSHERYEGKWLNNAHHGRGIYTYANGNWYEGEFRGGLQGGLGVAGHMDGRVFDGTWAEGCLLWGTAMAPDGTLARAVFKQGVFIWSAWHDVAARTPSG